MVARIRRHDVFEWGMRFLAEGLTYLLYPLSQRKASVLGYISLLNLSN